MKVLFFSLLVFNFSSFAQQAPDRQAEYSEYKNNIRILTNAVNSCVQEARNNSSQFYANGGDATTYIPGVDHLISYFSTDDYEQLLNDHRAISSFQALPNSVGTDSTTIGKRLGSAGSRERFLDTTLSNCHSVLRTMGINSVHRTPGVSDAQRIENDEIYRRTRRVRRRQSGNASGL